MSGNYDDESFYCVHGGWYALGAEDCDYCEYETECRDFQWEKLRREGVEP